MELITAKIKDTAYAGQGRGLTDDGRPVLVWDALPGESVKAQVFGNRSGMLEAVANEIIVPSPFRIKPEEKQYFISSPWQILQYSKELEYKTGIAREIFKLKSGIDLPDLRITDNRQIFGYRNTMEYGVIEINGRYSLAQLSRGRKREVPVEGSKLAYPQVDVCALDILERLKKEKIKADDVGYMHIRCSRQGQCTAVAYAKDGEEIFSSGPDQVEEAILGKTLFTGPKNFFQINPGCFELAASRIGEFIKYEEVVDYYGGVGTISIALSEKIKSSLIVESNEECIRFADINIKENRLANIKAIKARSEEALGYITEDKTIILNPPREGLHKTVVERLAEIKPSKLIYLSCKPLTQARDIKPLLKYYDIVNIELFNFFPRTPHIESLVILTKK